MVEHAAGVAYGSPRRNRATCPPALATGAYILHTGCDKQHGNEDQATEPHAMAAGAFPLVKVVRPLMRWQDVRDWLVVLSPVSLASHQLGEPTTFSVDPAPGRQSVVGLADRDAQRGIGIGCSCRRAGESPGAAVICSGLVRVPMVTAT